MERVENETGDKWNTQFFVRFHMERAFLTFST